MGPSPQWAPGPPLWCECPRSSCAGFESLGDQSLLLDFPGGEGGDGPQLLVWWPGEGRLGQALGARGSALRGSTAFLGGTASLGPKVHGGHIFRPLGSAPTPWSWASLTLPLAWQKAGREGTLSGSLGSSAFSALGCRR